MSSAVENSAPLLIVNVFNLLPFWHHETQNPPQNLTKIEEKWLPFTRTTIKLQSNRNRGCFILFYGQMAAMEELQISISTPQKIMDCKSIITRCIYLHFGCTSHCIHHRQWTSWLWSSSSIIQNSSNIAANQHSIRIESTIRHQSNHFSIWFFYHITIVCDGLFCPCFIH